MLPIRGLPLKPRVFVWFLMLIVRVAITCCALTITIFYSRLPSRADREKANVVLGNICCHIGLGRADDSASRGQLDPPVNEVNKGC